MSKWANMTQFTLTYANIGQAEDCGSVYMSDKSEKDVREQFYRRFRGFILTSINPTHAAPIAALSEEEEEGLELDE